MKVNIYDESKRKSILTDNTVELDRCGISKFTFGPGNHDSDYCHVEEF